MEIANKLSVKLKSKKSIISNLLLILLIIICLFLVDDIRIEMEKEYLSYFKTIINNLDEYYDRKSKRIMEKEVKRQRTDSIQN